MAVNRRELLGAAAAAAAAGAASVREASSAPAPPPRIGVRRASERGHRDHGWLDTRHTFSFASYHDPRWMGFRSLRVLNDDRVVPGRGFPTHPHRDTEIVTYVLAGSLRHRDSMGNGSVIVPGEVQRMSAASGVLHSEFNPSAAEAVHFLQIWILPDRTGGRPSYAQTKFPVDGRRGTLRLVVSPDGADGSIAIRQDARIAATLLAAGKKVVHRNARDRHVWVHLAQGRARLNGIDLAEGDGAWTSDPGDLVLEGLPPNGGPEAEALVFDLP